MSLQDSMLRCPEQTTIRYAAGHIERNGSDNRQGCFISTFAPNATTTAETTKGDGRISGSRVFETTTGTDIRRPQVRGERDGQSTDSGISDLSDKEDENIKHLSPNVTNAYMAVTPATRPPNAVALPNGAVGLQSSHANIHRVETNTSVSISPGKHACDREPVRNVGKNSPHNGAFGQTTITILNPPSGMHGPGRFRDDPRIDSKYVGVDNAAAVALDLTANHSSKTSSKTVSSIPDSAQLHPSLVARLNQPEQAIRPLMDRFGAVSQENISKRSNPEPVILSSPTPPNSSNSIPSAIQPRQPFHPIIHSQQPPGAMYDPCKLDRGLTQGMSPVQPLIPDHARNGGTCIPGGLPEPVAGELSVTNESRPLSDTVMQRLYSNGRTTKTKRDGTRPTLNTGVPSPVGRPLTSNAPPVAMSLSNTGVPIQPAYNGVPQQVYYRPRFNTRESQPVSRTLSNRVTQPAAQPVKTSQLINSAADQPNQPSSIGKTVSCQSAGQYIQNYPVSQQNRFPNQQHPPMANTFPGNCPQMFPFYTPRFQVGPPLRYTNNFQHQAVRTRGPGCANFYPNQLPAPSVNPAQMYQMRPQVMSFVHQQQTEQEHFVPQSKTRKRKYTRKRKNDATTDNSNESTVNKIITNIMAQCQSELPPVRADIPDSGSDRKDAHREILTVKSNIPDRAMNTNTLQSSVTSGIASESGAKVQSRPEVNYGDIQTSIAPRTPPERLLELSSGPTENTQAMYNPARSPRQFMVNGTVTTASSSCSSVRPSSKSPDTTRPSNSGTDIVANSHKTAEKCNMRNEGLGGRIEHQRSPSVPNITEQEDSNKSRNLPQNPAAAPGRNIFEEIHVTPRTSSRSSRAEQPTDKSPVPSSESNIHNKQLVSLAVDRNTASQNDQSSSYHRNLPKKRHLFEKHLSDSCISSHADLNEHKGTLPVDVERGATSAMHVEDSRISFTAPKSSEEQYKRDIVSQSEIGSEAPRSTRMGPPNPFKNEEAPTVAQNQPQNSTQKEQCDINLGDPQLPDSSQNPRPPAPIPCLFNYRFRPPTDVAPRNAPPVFHGGHMQPIVQSWPPMMPYYQCQPQMPPYRLPCSIPNNQNRMTAPSQVPPRGPSQRFDVKEKLAMFMKEKKDRKDNTQNSRQPEPGKEFTIPVDPRHVPLHVLPPPHQNGTLVFVDQNGVEWRPVDTKCSQPIQYSNGVHLLTPDSAKVMNVPDRAVKQVVPQNVYSNKHNLQKEVLQHSNNSQNDQQQQQQQQQRDVGFVNAGKCARLASDVKPTDVNLEIVINTSRLTGVDGVIINADEQTLRDERSRKRRGRKRKAPETALVPENVFVRAEERRKRHKLLPTPEALALGKTNTEDNEPHSLRSLAACAFSKLQSNEHFLKTANTLHGRTPFEARVKAKQFEVLAESMIASLVSDACAEREHRKTGLPVYREKKNEPDWSFEVDKYAHESNQNMNPLALALRPSQISISNRCIARSGDNILAPLEQVIRVQETDVRKDVKKQRVDSGFAGRSGDKGNVDVRHYRPKGMKKPKARIEDITETIMEVVRDSVTGQSSDDKDIVTDGDIEVSSMGTVEVHTEPFEETSTEKEKVTSVVDYEAQLQEILLPKAPAVVSEILEDMQLELRECLPEVASAEEIDSEDSSEESSDSDSDDEVHLGTVMLDGKEYRMRVVVEEDASRDLDGSESDSESNEESNSENRTTSTASAEMSFEDSYVEEGVDTFQDVETFDEEDDVFADTEDDVDRDPRRGMVKEHVSVINEDTDSDDGERGISHKRTTSCSSTDNAFGRDCNAQGDHTLNTEIGAMDIDVILSQPPDFTCEKSHEEPQFASEDISQSTKSSGTAETENDQFRSTKSNEVYVIENFNYTDKNGDRHDSIDEDKITDAIDIDESVIHQVDIEFVKVGPPTPSLPETLFERFGVNGLMSRHNSSDDEEDCHMYVTEPDVAISLEIAGDKTELNCPDLSPRALQVPVSPEPSPRFAQNDSSPLPSPLPIADTSTESDSMPVLVPCCVEQEPPIVSPCDEEPPILQYLGKPKNSLPSDRNETDSSPWSHSTSRNLCVSHIDFSESSRKQLKKRKKPKMISVSPQKAMLRDENDKENNDRDPSECISNANITTPECRARRSFRASISRFSNGYHSDFDQSVVDYEKPSAGRNNGPSPVIEAKSRPFSPVNYPNPLPNPKDRTVLDYCCQCRKNGKLRSPNRLHSLDELCPYSRYTCTKITDDPQYDYSSSDELTDSRGRRRSGKNGFKVDITNESKIHVNTDSEFVIHDISKPNPIRTSSSDLKGGDLVEANTTGDNDKTVSYIQETAAETDDRSQFDDGIISVPDCDTDALLNQFELSSDGTDSSLYRDDNGCDDFLYSSYESPPRLSDSMNSLKVQNETDTDSDDSQPQSEFGQIEPDSDLCDDLNDLQKCWVDLCDIGNFLQGKSRVKISDFVLYNESLCTPPPVPVFEILIDRQAERLEHEQRINQLKNKLKEVQRQVNLHLN